MTDKELLKEEIRLFPDDRWYSDYAFDTYVEIGQDLLKQGLDRNKVAILLQRLYWASRNEFHG